MNTFSNTQLTFLFSRVKTCASLRPSETSSDSPIKVHTTRVPDRTYIDNLRRDYSKRNLIYIPGNRVHVTTQYQQKKTLRTLPLLDVYEFQTLTDYAEHNLIFTPDKTLICTPITLLYEDYLKFFYQSRYNGPESFEEFKNAIREVKSKDKKTKRIRGLTTKYQFARALQHVAKENFDATLEKLRTRELVLQGVSLRNPNTSYLKDITYQT